MDLFSSLKSIFMTSKNPQFIVEFYNASKYFFQEIIIINEKFDKEEFEEFHNEENKIKSNYFISESEPNLFKPEESGKDDDMSSISDISENDVEMGSAFLNKINEKMNFKELKEKIESLNAKKTDNKSTRRSNSLDNFMDENAESEINNQESSKKIEESINAKESEVMSVRKIETLFKKRNILEKIQEIKYLNITEFYSKATKRDLLDDLSQYLEIENEINAY